MGVLWSKYCFRLYDADWWVRVGSTTKGLSYKVKIEGQLVLDEKPDQTSEEIISPQTFNVTHNGRTYELKIGPVSAFDCTVHVYSDGKLIYRHKDRDFVTLHRTEKAFKKMDKGIAWLETFDTRDPRPFWKVILEVCLIGMAIGTAYALLSNNLEDRFGWEIGRLGFWPAAIIGVCIAMFWPARLRFIR